MNIHTATSSSDGDKAKASARRPVGALGEAAQTTGPCADKEHVMKPAELSKVIVIGAGLSGLATGRALIERGIPVKILESHERVAEPWRARHPQLRLNIHRHFAQLPGRKMTRRDGTFVSRNSVVDYLEGYADDLGDRVQYATRVTKIQRSDTGWTVQTEHGDDYACDHLIVATGRDRVPYVPDWPGKESFAGKCLHAADLGDIRRYDGKTVLVVGAGNSGADVLNHLARHEPTMVWISVRHGPTIMPHRLLGFPVHRLAKLFALFPARALDSMFAATQRRLFGDLTRFGMRHHPDGGATRLLRDGVAFAIDDGFVTALKSRRFRVVPAVEEFDSHHALLADGTTCAPDVVIAATGYRTGLAPLLGHLGVVDDAGQPLHPMGEADPANPGLWFTGFRPIFTGYFDAAAIAAERIARGIAEGQPDAASAPSDSPEAASTIA